MDSATMLDVMRFFDMKPAAFKAEWSKMTDKDKIQLKVGIGNGSLTY